MKVHHIGIACHDINESLKAYINLGYQIEQDLVSDSSRNLDYIFIKNESTIIELIGKSNNKYKSDIDSIIASSKMGSDSIYHICYECGNILLKIEELTSIGFKILKHPKPALACDNRMVAFLFHNQIGMIELIQ
jgi:methylmalonyl-CoA/ethylmalonyl-CoA epimerase